MIFANPPASYNLLDKYRVWTLRNPLLTCTHRYLFSEFKYYIK